jgi:hypothetical protein
VITDFFSSSYTNCHYRVGSYEYALHTANKFKFISNTKIFFFDKFSRFFIVFCTMSNFLDFLAAAEIIRTFCYTASPTISPISITSTSTSIIFMFSTLAPTTDSTIVMTITKVE